MEQTSWGTTGEQRVWLVVGRITMQIYFCRCSRPGLLYWSMSLNYPGSRQQPLNFKERLARRMRWSGFIFMLEICVGGITARLPDHCSSRSSRWAGQ
jgi:hypothetical protein